MATTAAGPSGTGFPPVPYSQSESESRRGREDTPRSSSSIRPSPQHLPRTASTSKAPVPPPPEQATAVGQQPVSNYSLRLPSPTVLTALAASRASVSQLHERFSSPTWPPNFEAGLRQLRWAHEKAIASYNKANEVTEHWKEQAKLWHQEAIRQHRLAHDGRETAARLESESQIERACWANLVRHLPEDVKASSNLNSGFLDRLKAAGVEEAEGEEGMWSLADYVEALVKRVQNLGKKVEIAEEATIKSFREEQKARDAERDAKAEVAMWKAKATKLGVQISADGTGKANTQLSSLHHKLEDKDTEIAKLQAQRDALSSEISSLRDDIEHKDTEITKLQAQRDALKSENSRLETDLDTKSAALLNHSITIQTKQTEIDRLKINEQNHKEVSRLNAALTAKDTELARLNKSLEETEQDRDKKSFALSCFLQLYLCTKYALCHFFYQAHRWEDKHMTATQKGSWKDYNWMFVAIHRLADKEKGIWTLGNVDGDRDRGNGDGGNEGSQVRNTQNDDSQDDNDENTENEESQDKNRIMYAYLKQAESLLGLKVSFPDDWYEIECPFLDEMEEGVGSESFPLYYKWKRELLDEVDKQGVAELLKRFAAMKRGNVEEKEDLED